MSKGDGLGVLYWNGWGTSPSEHTAAFVSGLCVPASFGVVDCRLERKGSGFCRTFAHLWQQLEGRQMEQWIPLCRTCFTLGCCQLPGVQLASPFQASLLWETPNFLFLTLIFSKIHTWDLDCGGAGGAQPEGAPPGFVLTTCKVAQKTRSLGVFMEVLTGTWKMQFCFLCFLASSL